jgi:hypothetical protein
MCCTGTCQASQGADSCCGVGLTTYCTGLVGGTASCESNVCTACPVVSNAKYFVDPVNGSDQGSGAATAGCAFKTVKRALQVIGAPLAPTTILVVGPSTVSAGETFPIALPANVTFTTSPSSGAVTVLAPANTGGFTMSGPASSITGGTGAALTVTTTAGATSGTIGVLVGTGTDATTTLSNVTVTGMLQDGIRVTGGAVTILGGVLANTNGQTTATGNGLNVTGGQAIITVAAGGTPTSFNGNTAHGILVQQTGFITLTGAVGVGGNLGTGTIETNANVLAGVWIQQVGAGLAANTITGLASFGNTAGNGMRIVAGSLVTVRSSQFLGNKGNGVIISEGAGATLDTITGIDLGNTTTKGNNTFQAPLNAGGNTSAGICLDVANGQPALLAVGNQFQAQNCANAGGGALLLNGASCTNSVATCVTGVCDLGLINPVAGVSANTFNVSSCTQ